MPARHVPRAAARDGHGGGQAGGRQWAPRLAGRPHDWQDQNRPRGGGQVHAAPALRNGHGAGGVWGTAAAGRQCHFPGAQARAFGMCGAGQGAPPRIFGGGAMRAQARATRGAAPWRRDIAGLVGIPCGPGIPHVHGRMRQAQGVQGRAAAGMARGESPPPWTSGRAWHALERRLKIEKMGMARLDGPVSPYRDLRAVRLAVGRRATGRLAPGRLADGRFATGRLAVGRFAAGLLAVGRRAVGRLVAGRLVAGRRVTVRLAAVRLAAALWTGPMYCGRIVLFVISRIASRAETTCVRPSG